MAHKTYSQEQFFLQWYCLTVNFKIKYKNNKAKIRFLSSRIESLLFLNYVNDINFFCGTNMLFIKNFTIFFYVRDKNYFSLYKFFLSMNKGKF